MNLHFNPDCRWCQKRLSEITKEIACQSCVPPPGFCSRQIENKGNLVLQDVSGYPGGDARIMQDPLAYQAPKEAAGC